MVPTAAVAPPHPTPRFAPNTEPTRDIRWLVEDMASSSSSAEAGRRWLRWLRDGLSPPFRGSLSRLLVALRPLFPSDIFGGGGGGGGAAGVEEDGVERLSPARLQSAIWAAEGEWKSMRRRRGLGWEKEEGGGGALTKPACFVFVVGWMWR